MALAGFSIRSAHEEGFARYDLLAPADRYKLDWADACVDVVDYNASLTRRGTLYERLSAGPARERLKGLVRALPPGVARALSAALRRLAR